MDISETITRVGPSIEVHGKCLFYWGLNIEVGLESGLELSVYGMWWSCR